MNYQCVLCTLLLAAPALCASVGRVAVPLGAAALTLLLLGVGELTSGFGPDSRQKSRQSA